LKILVTGGAGYIGSHTLIELLESGHTPVVVDNLSNSHNESIKRVERITGASVPLHIFDLRDKAALHDLCANEHFDAVIHFAGLKAVGESVAKPLLYYQNNIDSTLILLEVMQATAIKKLIFSSSATVYGTPSELPLIETSQIGAGITNPYGWTKYMIEQILHSISVADTTLQCTVLRYFNPVGAHESGLIGEDPNGIPNNLLPYVAQVAVGKLQAVGVFGNDYDTSDGTGVRDYLHVVDLARGHKAALDHMQPGFTVYNLGTGNGVSVLQAIHAFEQACGHPIAYTIKPRRAGDIASCYASADKAKHELGWKAEKSFEQACADAWRWQSTNPNGYL
jgi:UDP-glucose 4-epimerase